MDVCTTTTTTTPLCEHTHVHLWLIIHTRPKTSCVAPLRPAFFTGRPQQYFHFDREKLVDVATIPSSARSRRNRAWQRRKVKNFSDFATNFTKGYGESRKLAGNKTATGIRLPKNKPDQEPNRNPSCSQSSPNATTTFSYLTTCTQDKQQGSHRSIYIYTGVVTNSFSAKLSLSHTLTEASTKGGRARPGDYAFLQFISMGELNSQYSKEGSAHYDVERYCSSI
ncbi:unnamed protein product [Ectocarpus sp. 4 AP-2014]